MRIVIDLKRGEVGEVVINNLYKHTQLQSSFSVTLLAIVNGRPQVLSLAELIDNFIDFRREVVSRRTEFELRKAEARRHVLEGLKIAIDHLDAVIALIRAAANPGAARDGLMREFELSRIQAQAILDMQLQRLTGLERQKVLDELAELLSLIERLRAILSSDELLMQIVVDELRAVQTKYGNDRRTEILAAEDEFRVEDLIVEEDMAITVSNTGYIKRDRDHRVSQPAARRQGPHRDADARRGLRQPRVHRLDPRLHHDLLGSRARVLAQGAHDPRCRPRRPGQGHR